MTTLFRGPNLSFLEPAIPGFVTVIIPVYQDHEGLAATLASLGHQTLPQNRWEVIVANDGGDSEVSRLCQRLGVDHIDLQPNGGSYFARNRGLERARGEFIAFVDADIEVPPQWLQIGLDALQTSDYVAGPVTINPLLVKTYAQQYEKVNAFPVEDYFKRSHFGPTANLFVRRQVFAAIGGFDQRLRSGGDLEFGDRVYRDTGSWRQALCADLTVTHPPRDLEGLKVKYLRVAQGHRTLATLHPDRFSWTAATPLLEFVKFLVPLNPVAVWKRYGSSSQFQFLPMYFFCWRMKILRGVTRLKMD